MKVHSYTNQLPIFEKAVITIGTFDGVHSGHCTILSLLKEEAAAIKGESVIITFHPHPRNIIQQNKDILLINTIEEKTALLEEAGIDHLVIVPFTEVFSKMEAAEYVDDFLIRRFHPHTVIIGYDHRFGKERKGDYKLLEAYAARNAFELKEIPEHIINNNTVSSTQIRNFLLEGNIADANLLLGYPFFLHGRVAMGRQLGRTIGFPTANIETGSIEKIIPADGVYLVRVELLTSANKRGKFTGMLNIGKRPTVEGNSRTIEVNIFDFNEDIYDKMIRIEFLKYLRPEQKFNGLQSLKEQLHKDEKDARIFFSENL